MVHPNNACKLEFSNHLWLPFLDQPQSYVAVFERIAFNIYNILVTKWKHEIYPKDIITFDEELEIISTSIIELVNIDESSHEEVSAILIKVTYLNKTKNSFLAEDDDGGFLYLSYP